jgi:hypothetical protein
MLTPPFRAKTVSGGHQVIRRAIKQAAVACDNQATAFPAIRFPADGQV